MATAGRKNLFVNCVLPIGVHVNVKHVRSGAAISKMKWTYYSSVNNVLGAGGTKALKIAFIGCDICR